MRRQTWYNLRSWDACDWLGLTVLICALCIGYVFLFGDNP